MAWCGSGCRSWISTRPRRLPPPAPPAACPARSAPVLPPDAPRAHDRLVSPAHDSDGVVFEGQTTGGGKIGEDGRNRLRTSSAPSPGLSSHQAGRESNSRAPGADVEISRIRLGARGAAGGAGRDQSTIPVSITLGPRCARNAPKRWSSRPLNRCRTVVSGLPGLFIEGRVVRS
jgi:hypothetical protein